MIICKVSGRAGRGARRDEGRRVQPRRRPRPRQGPPGQNSRPSTSRPWQYLSTEV
jgi:hypothetical protein